jgi:hypothetical protein
MKRRAGRWDLFHFPTGHHVRLTASSSGGMSAPSCATAASMRQKGQKERAIAKAKRGERPGAGLTQREGKSKGEKASEPCQTLVSISGTTVSPQRLFRSSRSSSAYIVFDQIGQHPKAPIEPDSPDDREIVR